MQRHKRLDESLSEYALQKALTGDTQSDIDLSKIRVDHNKIVQSAAISDSGNDSDQKKKGSKKND